MVGTVLSLMVLTAVALVVGAGWLWRRGGSRKHAVLMLILAVVLGINVAIWTLPGPDGAPVAQAPR